MPKSKAALKKKVTAQGSSQAVQATRHQGAEAWPAAEAAEWAEAARWAKAARWAAALPGCRNKNKGPEAILPCFERSPDGIIVVKEEDLLLKWCLVWRFTEQFHGKAGVKAVSESWNTSVRTLFHPDWVMFDFEKEEDMEKILSGGPYFAYGRPMVLKKMPRFFRYTEEELD